ncbi:hypothetical protein HMPREF1640_08695 [Prevotella sp. S7-1-8]|nr:hypothetical protein HMPREF1640_08695 [Prevotella sp. S7-1-8]
MSATRAQHAAAILGCHSFAKTMLVDTATIVGLECSFHLSILFLIYYNVDTNGRDSPYRAAKLLIIFQMTKNYMFFQSQIGVFFIIL